MSRRRRTGSLERRRFLVRFRRCSSSEEEEDEESEEPEDEEEDDEEDDEELRLRGRFTCGGWGRLLIFSIQRELETRFVFDYVSDECALREQSPRHTVNILC